MERTDIQRENLQQARENFPNLVQRVSFQKQRTIVSGEGKDLAAIVPVEDVYLLEQLIEDEMDRQDITDARAALAEGEDPVKVGHRKGIYRGL